MQNFGLRTSNGSPEFENRHYTQICAISKIVVYLRQVLFVARAGNSNLAKPQSIKFAMQCTSVKFTSGAYITCKW